MDKFLEVVKARNKRSVQNAHLNEVLMKTVENIAFEKAGKTPPNDDAEIFAEIMSIRTEMTESTSGMSDDAALIATDLFEEWNPGKVYNKGDRFMWNGNLYRAKKETVINPTWTPDVTYDYYEPVAKATEDGTINSPIQAVIGMTYYKDLYYIQDGKVYLCNRDDTGNGITLYHMPSALVGVYFEEVTQ